MHFFAFFFIVSIDLKIQFCCSFRIVLLSYMDTWFVCCAYCVSHIQIYAANALSVLTVDYLFQSSSNWPIVLFSFCSIRLFANFARDNAFVLFLSRYFPFSLSHRLFAWSHSVIQIF